MTQTECGRPTRTGRMCRNSGAGASGFLPCALHNSEEQLAVNELIEYAYHKGIEEGKREMVERFRFKELTMEGKQ